MGMTHVRKRRAKRRIHFCLLRVGLGLVLGCCVVESQSLFAQTPGQTAAPAKTPPVLGTIKSISANTIVLANETGSETKVQLNADVKFLRVPPGSKDLREAAPIQASDLQAGDRILVRGKPGDEPGTFVATTVISMKKSDLDEKKARDQEEWQRRGIGGLVKKVDAASGVVMIGTMSAAGAKDVSINVTKTTILRRYAPGSVKFDDAQASSIDEIRPGDQLRARGTRSDDGNSFAADEIVAGSFRNLSGTVSSVDAAAGTMTIADLISNKSITVRVKPDTQLRKLPAPMALMIAARLKGAPNGSAPPGMTPQGGVAGGGTAPAAGAASGTAMTPGTSPNKGPGGGGARGDLQQMLGRLPGSGLSDFQKGDAVLIVATASPNDPNPSAITVVGGVEPILQASTQAASILSPWSLSGGGGGDTGTP